MASRNDIQLICYPEWFVGIGPVILDSLLTEIKRVAAEHRIAICGGNLPEAVAGGGIQDHIFLVDSHGELVFLRDKTHPYQLERRSTPRSSIEEPEELVHGTVKSIQIAVLNGLDVADQAILSNLSHLAPDIVVIQLNPSSALEAEAIRELALSISETVSAVVAVPVLASDAQITGAEPVAVAAGEIVSPVTDSDYLGDGLIRCRVNPESLDKVPHLSEHILMPELLHQRLQSEVGGGTYFSDVGEPTRKR